MKFFKSILISITLLFVCSVSVLAQNATMPTQYIAADGTTAGVNFNGIISGSNADGTGTTPPTTNTLTATSEGNWYWAGQTGPVGTAAAANNVQIEGAATSGQNNEVNIVVGPNGTGGSAAALAITGGLTIKKGVTVNIYQAANGLGENTSVSPKNCFLWITGPAATSDSVSAKTTAQAGITVEDGGELNVYSGVITGVGGSATDSGQPATGVSVTGDVNVGTFGSLEGVAPAGQSNAITINTGGSIVSSGGVYSYSQAYKNAGSGISVQGTGNLTVQNGTVLTSTEMKEVTGLTPNNGLWLLTSPTSSLQAATAFGNAIFYNNLAFTTSFGNNESLTIPANTSLTLAGGNLNFGTTAAPTGGAENAQLTIGSGGTFNIGIQDPGSNNFNSTEPNVNMNQYSTLDNSGTITVSNAYSTTSSN